MGVGLEELAELNPVLFHMAAEGSWPSIQQHGLLSTSALLDFFEIEGGEREKIEDRHRPKSHPRHEPAPLRALA